MLKTMIPLVVFPAVSPFLPTGETGRKKRLESGVK